MLDNGRRIFFGDRPDDKQRWEDGEGRDERLDSAIAHLQGAANEQMFSDILEDLGRKTPGLYCPLCQKSFSRKWNRNQRMKDHCNTVSELKKGIAAVIAEASTASEEAETPPERAVSTPFLVTEDPVPPSVPLMSLKMIECPIFLIRDKLSRRRSRLLFQGPQGP
jgi:hypothetical protein